MDPLPNLHGIDDPKAEQAIRKAAIRKSTSIGQIVRLCLINGIAVAATSVISDMRGWSATMRDIAFFIVIFATSFTFVNRHRRRFIRELEAELQRKNRCEKCGYDREGRDSKKRCPECGALPPPPP